MKIAKLACGCLLAYTLAVACGGMSNHAGGSNTNWFETCNSTAECGSGLVCWCGVCTATCPTDCDVRAGATCSTPPVSCTDETKSACAVECRKDADCSALGSGASCVDSICRKGASAAADGGTRACDQLRTELTGRIESIDAAADKSCSTADDCVDVPSVSCAPFDCAPTLVSRQGSAAAASALATVEQQLCPGISGAGCAWGPVFCPRLGTPACVAGQCERIIPGTNDCDAIGNQIVDRLTTATGDADARCTKDADCTRSGPGASCLPECPYRAVSQTGAAAIASERSAVERDLCSQLDAQGCEPLIYTCPAVSPEPPVCVNGTCQDAGRDAGTTTCADRTARMKSTIEGGLAAVDKKCALDADCSAKMLSSQCYESCTYVPVSKSGAQQVDNLLAMTDANSCAGFADAGCTPIRLPCVAPPPVSCQNGQCALPR